LTAPVTVKIGNLTQVMGIERQAQFAGGATARLVGGVGWGRTVQKHAYGNRGGVPLSMVLRDVARLVGESVVIAQDRSVGLFYTRATGPASNVLRQLAADLWWVDVIGVTQVGPRAPSVIKSPATVADYRGGKGWLTVATEDLAAWRPAATFTSNTVLTPIAVSSSRIHADNGGTLRLEVLAT
jgi:hypothetical protein